MDVDMVNRSVTNVCNACCTCFNLSFVFLIFYNTDYIIFATFVFAFNSSIIGGEIGGKGQTHKPCWLLPSYLILTKVVLPKFHPRSASI